MIDFGQYVLDFYTSLQPGKLPRGYGWLHPQQQPAVREAMAAFYARFFSDTNTRTLAFGINPGRYGAGITGINFTAPLQLTQYCGIAHSFGPSTELSAVFIYEMIEAYGGPAAFYRHFFISSVCPLGLIKDGRNINYYDDPVLLKRLTPFIVNCIEEQYRWPVNRHSCICIGGEKNFRFFNDLNQKHGWFQEILPLPHPRFILQYRRREKQAYLTQYLETFARAAAAG